MKVLVTGSSGFIGRSLVDTLSRKNLNVKGLSRKNDLGKPDHIQCDLNQPQSLDSVLSRFRPETIVHSAGSILIQRSGNFDSVSYQNNINSTSNLLASASKFQVKRFIFLSTNSVYGPGYSVQKDAPLAPNPHNWYSKSKWMGEQLVSDFRGAGMETLSLRLPIVIGPGKKEGDLVTEMIQSLRNTGLIHVYGKGLAHRPLIDIQDVCEILYQLIESRLDSQITAIPVGHPNTRTIHEIAECIRSNLATGSLQGKIELHTDRPESPDQMIDPRLLQDLIPFQFRISPEEAILRTLDGASAPAT